ncbi:MAG: hypothetical protein DMG22_23220 [Acidobacteria bacterium]|nr:MAG: hypothetical protein DMG22_23220 [Acidobacteriota bacterium]
MSRSREDLVSVAHFIDNAFLPLFEFTVELEALVDTRSLKRVKVRAPLQHPAGPMAKGGVFQDLLRPAPDLDGEGGELRCDFLVLRFSAKRADRTLELGGAPLLIRDAEGLSGFDK